MTLPSQLLAKLKGKDFGATALRFLDDLENAQGVKKKRIPRKAAKAQSYAQRKPLRILCVFACAFAFEFGWLRSLCNSIGESTGQERSAIHPKTSA